MNDFLNHRLPWGRTPHPTMVAIHMLLVALPESEVASPVARLAEILGVVPRTIQRHLELLREAGHVRGPAGRIELVSRPGDRTVRSPDRGDRHVATLRHSDHVKRQGDHVGRHTDRSSDTAIMLHDPPVDRVAALTTAKRSEAKPASLGIEIDLVLEEAAKFTPVGPDGAVLRGRAISVTCPHARAQVELLIRQQALQFGVPGEAPTAEACTAAAEGCRRYVAAYAAICERDVKQRRYWSVRMFGTVVEHGRRVAAWDVVMSEVDRAALPVPRAAAPARVDAVVRPGRYGGGKQEL